MKSLLSSSKVTQTLLRPYVTHPVDYPLMEFRYGLWVGLSAIFGEDDRQLGEGNTRPLIFNKKVPAETVACKYKGSRHGKHINMSALRVAMGCFYETTAITVAVRDYYMEKLKRPRDSLPGLWDLYAISRASLALIAYRYRADNISSSEKLRNDLGSQYKLVSGVFMICRDMTAASHPGSQNNGDVSAKELFDFADENAIFLSPNDMACAGSQAKIIEFLEFINLGRTHPEARKLNLEDEHGHLDLLQSLVSDVDNWFQYAMATIELDHFIEIEILLRKLEGDKSSNNKLKPVYDVYVAQHQYWLDLLDDRNINQDMPFETGALVRQNNILTLLGRPTINRIPKTVKNRRLDR